MIRVGLDDRWNLQFRRSALLISLAEVVGRVPPSRLCQFVKLHLLLPKPLHAVLYQFGDCAHHPAGFVMFSQLALLCFIVFFFIFRILLIVGTCKIAQTDSHSIQHLFQCLSGLLGGQSHRFNIAHIFLPLLNRCLCVLNSLSCHRGLSLHIILYPLHFLFIAQEVRFSFLLHRELLFGLQVTQCSNGSDPFSLQPALPFIRLITSSCRLLGWFAIFARRERGKVHFWSIDHCISCWLLLGEMLDVGRYGPYGGKLRLLCQGWYAWSTRTKQILCFDRHWIGNSHVNRPNWLKF